MSGQLESNSVKRHQTPLHARYSSCSDSWSREIDLSLTFICCLIRRNVSFILSHFLCFCEVYMKR